MPYREPTKGEIFRKRLAVYLTGVAIGLVALGLFQMARQNAAQRYQQQQAQQGTQPDGSAGSPPEAQNATRSEKSAPSPAPASPGSAE